MKRLSRHTVVVLLVALGVCLGGMSLAVGAFGQSGGDPDATVPLGDYTQTTPATSTAPLSSYTTTSQTTTPTDTGAGLPVTTNGAKPETTHGTKPETTHGRRDVALPSSSKATRSGPEHLAFTGGEPIVVGAAGAALMLAGLALHRRRRQRPAA
jgi:MYXO-CTERM domain-containing protein